MSNFSNLLQIIHRGKNPYSGFPVSQWRGMWFNDPGATAGIFERAIAIAKPGIIVEVGSFVGESAIFMAKKLIEAKADAAILCIDTWCGGVDHWTKANEKIQFHFGRQDLYYRFIANVIEQKADGVIVPLCLDSQNAARLLAHLKIVPSLIYVDASHEAGDVLRDLQAYWSLLEIGGVLVADDISDFFPGVVEDVNKFIKLNKIPADQIIKEKEKRLFVK